MNKVLTKILLCAATGGVLAGCLSGNDAPEIAQGTAMFDCFYYEGMDRFYEENPLPDEQSFYTPILPGWYSDPSICTNGKGDYFLVTSTFTYFPGVPIFHSRDLVNWKQVGHVLSRPSQLVNMENQHVSGGLFAPAISYNPHNETYYMITTNVGAGNFYVKTKDPFGEWSDPIRVPQVGGIDPSFFFDEDGKAYVVNNDDAPDFKAEYDGHRTIRVQEFDWKNDKMVGPRKILVNKGVHPEEKPIWIEGPHMYKINGKYYLMDAEGGTSVNHSEVIFRSDSPWGPFEPWDKNPILTQRHLDPNRSNPITCAGHADILQTPEGDWWGVFLACRPIDNKFENLGRETFLMPVQWSEDGFPYFMQGDEEIPMIARREGVKRGEEVTFGNFTVSEEFSDSVLGMQWMTLRGPATNLYSLTQTPGYLTLKCVEKSAKERGVPALVCRRMQHHNFTTSTRMYFNPANSNEKAGLMLFKDETHQYFMAVSQSEEGRIISLTKVNGDEDKVIATHKLPQDAICFDLLVYSEGTAYEFAYSLDKGNNWTSLAVGVSANHLSTAEAGGFTGTTIALHATSR